jgi:tetratricopeptide (TPR) repeat protein
MRAAMFDVGKKLTVLATLLLMFLSSLACNRNPQKQAEAELAKARESVRTGKLSEAMVELRRAIQLNPNLAAAHLEFAKLHLERNDFQNERFEIVNVLKLEPKNYEARYLLAELELKAGTFADARADVEQLRAENPNDTRVMLISAASSAGMSDFKSARTIIDHVLELEPKNAKARVDLSFLQYKDGEAAKAEQSLRTAIDLEPNWMLPTATLAAILTNENNNAGAEAVLRQAVSRNPDNIQAYSLLGQFLLKDKRIAEAEQNYRRISSLGEKIPETRGKLAQFYLVTGDKQKAEQEYLRIIKQHSDDYVNRRGLAAVYASEGQITEAEDLLNVVLKHSSTDPEAFTLRGRLRMQEARVDEAILDLQRAIQVQPKWDQPHNYLAQAYLKQGKVELARGEFQEVVQLNPNATEAQVVLAQMDLSKGDTERAIAALDKATAQKPQVIKPYLLRSMALAQHGDYSEAEKTLLPLLSNFPDPSSQVLTFRSLALVKMSQREYVNARNFLKRALQLEPTREDLSLLGFSYVGEKHPDQGLREILAYVRAHDQWAGGYEVAGNLSSVTGHPADAERYLQKALELDPKQLSARQSLGLVFAQQGKYDQAIDIYSKLSIERPNDAKYTTRLGILYQMIHDYARAETEFKKSLNAAPEDAIAGNNLAWLYAEQRGNIDEALKLAQNAKEKQPDNPSISDTLGWVLVKKHSYESAIQMLRPLVDKDPKNPVYQYHLGVAYSGAGIKAEARKSLETALKLQPDFAGSEDAKKVLAQLAH